MQQLKDKDCCLRNICAWWCGSPHK